MTSAWMQMLLMMQMIHTIRLFEKTSKDETHN